MGNHLAQRFRFTIAFGVAILLWLGAAFAQSGAGSKGDIVVRSPEGKAPGLVFACDRATSDLPQLFTPAVIADLQQLKAGVALSTEDLTPERAQIVHALNEAGVPMTAWIALPKSEGYYINADDAPQTVARFEEFDRWTTANHLHWQAVGLDIEPSLSEYGALTGHKGHLLSLIIRRAFDSSRVFRSRAAYAALIARIRERGYLVQTYQLQFLADERRVHTTLLERIFGIVDVRGDDEVLMLYTSFNHAVGAGIIWQYGPDAQTIAVGSTAASGDAAMDAKFPALNWDEFSRDLIVASHFSKVVGVYSLEGCVRQGFLPRLKTLDWTQPVVIPADSVHKAAGFRKAIFAALWFGSHLIYFVVALLLVILWLARFLVHRRRRKRALILPSAG